MSHRLGGFAILLSLLSAVGASAQPANDTCGTATAAATLPFQDSIDTTTANTDPVVPSCGAVGNTAWYSYTATTFSDVSLDIDTAGSAYAPLIAVYDGTCTTPTELACHAAPVGGDGRLAIRVAAGATVFIQIGDPAAAGGPLVTELREAPYQIGAVSSLIEVASSTSVSSFGTAISYIGRPTALSPSKIAFAGVDQGIFTEVGGVLTKIAASGDPTPVGGVYSTFLATTMWGVGFGAFHATIEGLTGGTKTGVFAFNGGVITAVAVEGDPAPTGGLFTRFGSISMNLAGDLAFIGWTDTPDSFLFELPFGGALAARIGASAVDPCGGNFLIFDSVDINIWGHLAFTATHGSYFDDGVSTVAVACDGAAAPGVGGTYSRLGEIVLNDVPEVAFIADVSGGLTDDVVFSGPPAAVVPIAGAGQVATSGETLDRIDWHDRPVINNAGRVAFYTDLAAPDHYGIAVVPAGGAPAIAVKDGDPCGGGSIRHLGSVLSMNGGGIIISEAACGIGYGVIRIAPGGLSKVAFHTDGTAVGPGFLFEPGEIDVGGDSLLIGKRSAVYGVRCGAGGCTAPTALVAGASPWPVGLNTTVRSVLTDSVGGARIPVFTAILAGPSPGEAIAMARGGVRKIVQTSDPTPDGLGTFDYFTDTDPFSPDGKIWRPAGHGGKVAFAAVVSHPQFTRGVFLGRGGVLKTVIVDGKPSPDGGTYVNFSTPAIQGKRIAFATETSIGACVMLSLKPTKPLIKIACVGDPGPAPGTTIDAILGPPTIDRGVVTYAALVGGTSAAECILDARATTPTAVVCSGDPQPGGGTFASFAAPYEDVTLHGAYGEIAFSTLDDSDSVALHALRKSTIAELARQDAAVASGGTYDLDECYVSTSKRTAVFRTGIDGGIATSALFRARLP